MNLITGIIKPSRSRSGGWRGQILSSEFIIAASIFMFVLLTVLVMWTTTIREINRSEVLFEMDDSATNAVEKLVRTSGFPVGWESLPVDDVLAIGLVNESRVLDPGKVRRFLNLMDNTSFVNPCGGGVSNYECNRHFLGLGRYDFLFNVTYLNGSVVSVQGVDCVTGLVPGDVEFMLARRRNALLGDEIVQVTLTVFYGEGSGSAVPGPGPVPGVCNNNNVREGSEQCDGTDDAACPGLCQADCTCPAGPGPPGPPGAESVGVPPGASGHPGETVPVPVNISNSQGSIIAIGFDVHYDNGIISLVDVQRGDLTAAWDTPSYASYGWGSRVTIVFGGGSTYISPGSTGSVVELYFNVVGGSGTSPMNIDNIQLSNMDGVVDTAPSLNGTFTVT